MREVCIVYLGSSLGRVIHAPAVLYTYYMFT